MKHTTKLLSLAIMLLSFAGLASPPDARAINDAAVMVRFTAYKDNGGKPGQATTIVTSGQSFFIEITARDSRRAGTPAGLIALPLTMTWNATLLESVEAWPNTSTTPGLKDDIPADKCNLVTCSFPLFRAGVKTAGKIESLRGGSLPAASTGKVLGKTGLERFALLKFKAKAVTAQSKALIRITPENDAAFADGTEVYDILPASAYITVKPR